MTDFILALKHHENAIIYNQPLTGKYHTKTKETLLYCTMTFTYITQNCPHSGAIATHWPLNLGKCSKIKLGGAFAEIRKEV